MLAKKYRLPIQNFAGKSGKTAKSPNFSVKKFENLRFSRFGVIISKKVSKKSTERNRIKREIFNFLREIKGNLPAADYLIIVYPGAARFKKEDMRLELGKLLTK